jgi:group I intron endonuclease
MKNNNKRFFGIIYKSTNLINGKCYIGQTTKSLDKRIKDHVNDTKIYRDNSYFHNAIRKYGIDNFKWEILCKCDNKLLLNIRETMKIIVENSYWINGKGYNLTWGGDGWVSGQKHTEETKKKMSESRKGSNNPMFGRHLTDEQRKRRCESSKGSNNNFYGKKHTEETKAKIREKRKNQVITEEMKEKIRKRLKGKKRSKETIEKISNSLKNRKLTKEHIQKMSEVRRKYNDDILLYIKKMLNEGISRKIIANKIGFSYSTICKWIRCLIKE